MVPQLAPSSTTPAPVDPAIAQVVLRMVNSGESLRAIGNETGLLDKEIRLVVDEDRRKRSAPSTAGRSPTVGTVAPRPAQPQPADGIAELIDQAEKSNLAKVRGAARRAAVAVEALRVVMAATDAERKEAARLALQERKAREAVDALAVQLADAQAALDAITPKKKRGGQKGSTLNLTPEDRERRRQQAYAMQAKRLANIAERKAAADVV